MTNNIFPGTGALRVFESAGRHLNFTKAADEVGLTPAAVSYQIKEIEERLGLVLFQRTSRKINLTPAGSIMLGTVSEILTDLRKTTALARKESRKETKLRITLGARIATNWLFPRLSEFKHDNPELTLEFDITDTTRDLETDDVDVAIRFCATTPTQMVSHRLFGTSVVAICNPELLKKEPTIKNPQDLLQHTLCYVNCQTEGMTWPNWHMWMNEAGVDEFDETRTVAFSDLSNVVQAVSDGGAVGLAEPAMIASELKQGRLVKLFDTSLKIPEQYAYHFIYPDKYGDESAIKTFRKWLLKQV